ncbi:hypothetical protein HYH03_018350 [Edaphochlamys debaryana]|uniref:MYND-type domain-containing protein n=1 Tax=Edaphochlamys debaryana TaxID=47281 RepID=A0A836BN15_9CHLO|nr:hypothetical protein HYH03_018350 [Edaphochlamys debaryana]|eukprot:KAG2482756.1 hypothetical protein HYH03_018350 [Edaphochlamys debaryana]
MAAQAAQTLMCPEAEANLSEFFAHAQAVLAAGAEASPALLNALASSTNDMAARPCRWLDADETAAGNTAADLLGRPAFKQALLLIANEVTRWSWAPAQRSAEEHEGLRAKVGALRAVELLCGSLLLVAPPTPPVLDFARRLVRSQTLEALSGRLSDARAELDFLSDQAAAAAAAGGAGPFVHADACSLLLPLVASVGAPAVLTRGCLMLAVRVSNAAPQPQQRQPAAASGAAPEPSAPAQPAGAAAGGSGGASDSAAEEAAAASASYAQELAAALRASAVVEHTCIALASVLRLWDATGPEAIEEHPGVDPAFLRALSAHADKTVSNVTSTFPALHAATEVGLSAGLRIVAALGPAAFYSSVAHGIAVLSALDGETSYGLDPAVLAGFTRVFWVEVAERLESGSSSGVRRSKDFRCVGPLMNLAASLAGKGFILWDPAAASGIFPPFAVLPLAMRVARVGVQAADEAAGRTEVVAVAALRAAQQGTGPCRVLLDWTMAPVLAVFALQAASSAMRAGAGPEGSACLGEEWWRLAAALTPHLRAPAAGFPGVSLPSHYGKHILAELPSVTLAPAPLPLALPPAPPLGLESALAGGVLPCLERLFRRAAASLRESRPDSSEVEALLALNARYDDVSAWLAPLLAWGNARQAAALVRTIGKGLEATAAADTITPDDTVCGDAVLAMASHFLTAGRLWLEGLAASRDRGPGSAGPLAQRAGPGGGGAGAHSPAERQLLEMLAAAAAAWLPPMCRLLWARFDAGAMLSSPLITCLCWQPVLARVDATHGTPTRPSAVVAAGPAAAGAAAGSSASGAGWGTALTDPVRLVRVALRMVDGDGAGPVGDPKKVLYLRYLAQACCTVAAAFPEEVAGRGRAGPVWETSKLRALTAELRTHGHAAEAEAAEALPAQLVRWAHGSGPRGGRGGARASAASGAQALAARFGAWFPGLEAAAALLPASPAAARACLGGCSNPACANLEGDSDAALPLRACAGCGGAASYCSRECQTAHWRSGHREACRVRGG